MLALLLAFNPLQPLMPSNFAFRVHIPSTGSGDENVPLAQPQLATVISFALPGSAAEDQLRRAPTSKPRAAYNILKSRLSTWNINTPNVGEVYDNVITPSSASGFSSDAMDLDNATEREARHTVDGDGWMATEPPGPFPL